MVEMPEQGSRFVPEGGKQVDILDRSKDFIAKGFERGGGQVEKGKTGGVVSLNMIISINY